MLLESSLADLHVEEPRAVWTHLLYCSTFAHILSMMVMNQGNENEMLIYCTTISVSWPPLSCGGNEKIQKTRRAAKDN